MIQWPHARVQLRHKVEDMINIPGKLNDIYQSVQHKLYNMYYSYCRERDIEYRNIARHITMQTLIKRYYEFRASENAYRQMTVISAVVAIVGNGVLEWGIGAIAAVGVVSGCAWAYNCVQRRLAVALGRMRFKIEAEYRENEMRHEEMARRNAFRAPNVIQFH